LVQPIARAGRHAHAFGLHLPDLIVVEPHRPTLVDASGLRRIDAGALPFTDETVNLL
jgi:hypothetical protein